MKMSVVFAFRVLVLVLNCVILISSTVAENAKPNIVIIMADDLGWNDVGFHGSDEIPTPNIDALAYNGIILNRHYVPPMCTPSRASLMTGKYPIHTGMQHFVIASDEPFGLGLHETIMPQYFQAANYTTHLVGKWHLGFHERAYTPTMRGFDTHSGYLGPYIDYWDHTLIMLDRNYSRGLDMRKNLEINYESQGIYATEYFTDEAIRIINEHNADAAPMFLLLNHLAPHAGNEDEPMQPPENASYFDYIPDPKRRMLAAMIESLDIGVGKVVEALNNNNMLNNTIILFYSDNGAPTSGLHSTAGSNYPLKGQKRGPWEGAVRGVAAIWSSQFVEKSIVSNQLIHVSDWLPTLLAAAGIDVQNKAHWDGVNHWDVLCHNTPTLRTEIINTIDEVDGFSSILENDWKLINGTVQNGIFDIWMGTNNEEYVSPNYAPAVMNSQAALALSRAGDTQLTQSMIKYLREEAIIKCAAPAAPSPCNPLLAPCLFNILQDPCEYNNLAETFPAKLNMMLELLEKHRLTTVPTRNEPADARSSPENFNSTWHWWLPDEVTREEYEAMHASNLKLDPISDVLWMEEDDNMRITTIFLIIVSAVAFILLVAFIAASLKIKSLRKNFNKTL